MNRTPRDIETKFRNSLGAIGPYMCLVDVASRELANNHTTSEIEKITKLYKHRRLAVTDLELQKMSIYVNLAHLAFITSRADKFCEEFVEFHKGIVQNTSSYNIDTVDMLRKSIFLVHARKNGVGETTKKLDESTYQFYAGCIELRIVDYYRAIRNVEFHGGLTSTSKILNLSEEELNKIERKYNCRPSSFEQLSVRDVILYSQAWQAIAVNICRKLVDVDESLINKYCKIYANAKPSRRDNAITQKLKQDYLQLDDIIDTLRTQTNGWVA